MFYFQDQIIDYVCEGKVSGSFCFHLMVGDVYNMIDHADDTNKLQIVQLATWIKCHAPNGCWGSISIVQDWSKAGGLLGLSGQETVDRWKIINDIEV